MGWFKQLRLSLIILSVAIVGVSCQELRSTLREGNRACQGEEVIFTCTIRGPSTLPVLVLAWSSTEYIGQGGSLQLSTVNMLGDVEASTMDGSITANATVTNNTNVAGELTLESTLRITAVEASTVTCMSGAGGGTESIVFTVSAVPGVPQRISATEISRPVDNICVILVTWDPPANSDVFDIDQYRVYVRSRNIRNDVSSSSTLTTLTVMNCGVDIHIQVAAVSHGCEGLNSSEIQLLLLDIPTAPTASGSATTEGGSTPTSSQLDAGVVAVIVISSTLYLLFSVVFAALFYYFLFRRLCRPDKDGDSESLLLHPRSSNESLEPATNPKTENVEHIKFWDLQMKALVQAKKCYKQQSVHDFHELGTVNDRVRVPIWIDDNLDGDWKAYLDEAVKDINEAAPGLILSTDSNKNAAIVHVLAIDTYNKKAYTKSNIQTQSIPEQADSITEIHLGKWEDGTKKGIITRELLSSLGCNQITKLGLTRLDPYSIMLYQNEKAYKTARREYREDPVWQLKQNPTERNTSLSELDKVGLNLVYRPCKDTTDNNARYAPNLGKTGMYYCGRCVMNKHTYDGYCGPNKGPNCPACRTIKNTKVDEILSKGKWQGMTGRVYCGRLFAEPAEIEEDHDGICGINNGPACPDCNDLLNKEIYIN